MRQAYVKKTINPLIESHPRIAARQGERRTDDSLGFKKFQGMSVEFLAATTSNLVNKSFRRIVADEWDAYDPAFGDPKTKLDVRRQTYGRDSMLLALSHPDRAGGLDIGAWKSGIMAVYADSTRCTWWWACRHCGEYCSPNPNTHRHCALVYPEDGTLDEIQAQTHLLCPNGCVITDADREPMLATGRWIGRGEHIDPDGTVTGARIRHDTAGFWIVGAMSPFLINGIGGLARALVQAQRNRETDADERSVREVYTKQWGIPYDPPRPIGAMDAAALAERAEPFPLGTVPDGVRFLTAAVDIQANRFEYLVRGWGQGGESWIVLYGTRTAETATDPAAWSEFFDWLTTLALPLADASGRAMQIRAVGYDSGGAPGTTLRAYDAWRRAKSRGQARRLGRVNGRDAWTLLPLKGSSSLGAPRLTVAYPDSQRADRFAGARGQIPLGQFNPNLFKDDLAGHLAAIPPAAWSVHIPEALRAEAAPHPFFEGLVAETRKANGVWVPIPGAARNEPLDLMVIAHVMAHLHGLARLDWSRPPAWAAEWGNNALVITPEASPPSPITTSPIGTRPTQAARSSAPARLGAAGLAHAALQRLAARTAL